MIADPDNSRFVRWAPLFDPLPVHSSLRGVRARWARFLSIPALVGLIAGWSAGRVMQGSGYRVTRISKIGNAVLRAAFYMPAMSAMRFNPAIVALVTRLKSRGRVSAVSFPFTRERATCGPGVRLARISGPTGPSIAAGGTILFISRCRAASAESTANPRAGS
jgi:hypothetical protein